MMNKVPPPSIEDFKRLYEKADQYAKRVSLIGGEAVIPAYNELRNAGYHLQKALGSDGYIEHPEELRKGIAHCQRALYEASEAGIIVALEKLKDFDEDYRGINISNVIPGVRRTRTLIRQARSLLPEPRPISEKAQEATDIYMNLFEELLNGISELEDNRADLDAEREKERKVRRQANVATIKWLIGIIIGLLSIIVTIMVA